MGATTTVFDTAAAKVTNSIATATPEQVMFICRETFVGIAQLLAPVLKDVKDLPVKSLENAEASLTKIYAKYWELMQKGGIDREFEDEIEHIMPDLQEAISQISTAVDIRRNATLSKDKSESFKSLPSYKMAIMKGHWQIGVIIKYIRGLDEIDIANTG